MPGPATAGTPSEATAAIRSGASRARQSAHIPPSEVPTIGARSRPSASSSGGCELGNRVRSQRPAAVVEGVAQAESREVKGDEPMALQGGHQGRPRRGAHAAAVNENERRAIAHLQDPNSHRRVRGTHTPARNLHPARREQPALGLLEGHRCVIMAVVWRHGWVPLPLAAWVRSSRTVEPLGLAHRISRKQDRLLDRIRDPSAAGAASFPGTADTFDALISEEYALLVTFRRWASRCPPRCGSACGTAACMSRASPMPARSSAYDRTSASAWLRALFAASRRARSLRAWGGSSGRPGAERRDRARSALRPTPATIREGRKPTRGAIRLPQAHTHGSRPPLDPSARKIGEAGPLEERPRPRCGEGATALSVSACPDLGGTPARSPGACIAHYYGSKRRLSRVLVGRTGR